jgi:hypothetical protein
MVGAASQVNTPTPHLYKEEHVGPGQPHRVDAEEVDREEQVGVLADELPPGALTSPRCGRQAMAAKHLADGQVGASVAKFEELALDPAVAPPWVLLGDAKDQLVKLADGNCWLAGAAVSGRPPTCGGPARDATEAASRGWAGEIVLPSWAECG